MWIYWHTSIFRLVLDSSVRIVVAAAAVATILWVARIRSSSLQHQAWTVVLGAMLAMPRLSTVIPPVAMPRSVTVLVDKVPEVETIARATTRTTSESGSRSTNSVPAMPSIDNGSAPEQSLWPLAIFVVYTAGLLGLLLRLILGWLGMKRLLRSSRAASPPGEPAVLESDLVSTPLTCGVVHPRIVLPRSWKEWPAEKLHAVLVHERTHIARWDARVAFLAQLNRAIFWFHPLSWWLERKLAILAEQACDDAVVREIGEPARYAETLVEIAAAVHRRSGRFSWQGIGVTGNGILQSRIHRLLRGNFLQNVSPLRKAAIAFLCFGSVVYVAAVHGEIISAQYALPPGTSQIASLVTAPAAVRTAQAINIQASSTPEVPANPSRQAGARSLAIPVKSLGPTTKVSADSLNIVGDALTNAADNLLKSANQSDYVQKAIALLDQALDDAKRAAAHVNDDSAPAAPTAIPNFDAAPPPAPLTNFMLYSSLNSLKFAYDALNRVPGGDFGGYRTRINNDISAVAEVLVSGIASYNAKHPQ